MFPEHAVWNVVWSCSFAWVHPLQGSSHVSFGQTQHLVIRCSQAYRLLHQTLRRSHSAHKGVKHHCHRCGLMISDDLVSLVLFKCMLCFSVTLGQICLHCAEGCPLTWSEGSIMGPQQCTYFWCHPWFLVCHGFTLHSLFMQTLKPSWVLLDSKASLYAWNVLSLLNWMAVSGMLLWSYFYVKIKMQQSLISCWVADSSTMWSSLLSSEWTSESRMDGRTSLFRLDLILLWTPALVLYISLPSHCSPRYLDQMRSQFHGLGSIGCRVCLSSFSVQCPC